MFSWTGDDYDEMEGNPIIYAGFDDIHATHINQLITELRKIDCN